MSDETRIQIVAESAIIAESIRSVLAAEFLNILLSIDFEQGAADFETYEPHVLVLAFSTLDVSDKFYVGLYLRGMTARRQRHRVIVLCDKTAVEQAYELCRDGHYDDYVVFWPPTFDTRRLHMALRRTIRDLQEHSVTPAFFEVSELAKRAADLESAFSETAKNGGLKLGKVAQSIADAQAKIGAALDTISTGLQQKLILAEGDVTALRAEVTRIKDTKIPQRFRRVNDAMGPMREWMDGLAGQMGEDTSRQRSPNPLASTSRPLVLVVDDDGFQCKVLAQLLEKEDLELTFAASGVRALTAMHKRVPDIILMDIFLPDINGIDLTRQILSMTAFSTIPVIMVTGQGERSLVTNSIRAGAVDFIVKPFDKAVLLRKLYSFL